MIVLRVTKYSFILLLLLLTGASHADVSFNKIKLNLNGLDYQLEIADNRARKRQGLMFRTTLGEQQGMLFVYSGSDDHRIWMRNTRLPLTVLWLDESAQIISKQQLPPCLKDPCPIYQADKPSRYILELHTAAFNRFKLGQTLPDLLNNRSAGL